VVRRSSQVRAGGVDQVRQRRLQSEDLAQLAFDGGLSCGADATVPLENAFAGEFNDEMTATRGLVFKTVRLVEEDFMRPQRTIGRADRRAHKAVEILKLLPSRQVVWR